ncbi:hypothetical protein BD289DRAFT_473082 [Coniella lustricola]|uniref:Peroxisomal ATPase PEX6 n=1 Tax=Coniella lustricola TaxID=2025994 RepID=A0A2T3ACY4_9PEZI|nr:hypothetical protein BD289DRAFT_473082 [Coniella lustricola]
MAPLGLADASRRQRKRRRRQDKPPVTARLVLDDHVKGDVGILSQDLFADLFPHLGLAGDQDDNAPLAPDVVHVALAPWAPTASPDTTDWTIVPVTQSAALAHSTVQFSPASLALQSFATYLQQVAPSKLSSHSRSGIEILVLDVLALSLDTVFVSLEGELARRLEDGEGVFFRDHPDVPAQLKNKDPTAGSAEDRLKAALRVALGTLQVVHTGDLFPLPLAPHPVTHVPPNPGKVTLCEPIAQGILSPTTKIIVSRGRIASRNGRMASAMSSTTQLNGVTEDAEDTANDQFYSAAEERYRTESEVLAESTDAVTETEESDFSMDDHDELSDDSMDDMISLQAPALPATAASGVSTIAAGTPMTLGRGRKTNGFSTPGSVFSSFTATTARQDRPRGRLFKAQGLMSPIPAELLHPKVMPEDDEEARIYVDVSSLSKIGCFSGDWVRLEASQGPPSNGFGHFGLGSFGQGAEQEPDWRPVRVFGLPEGYSHRPVTTRIAKSKSEGRRLSFFEAQIQKPSSPVAYASPLLLANLETPPYLRLAPLKRSSPVLAKNPLSKLSGSAQPPYAREVTLRHVRTPKSVERNVQSAVMAGIKYYFEKKLRMVRSGDLIAFPVDTQLGKILQEADGLAVDDMLSLTSSRSLNKGQGLTYDEAVWFKVTNIVPLKTDKSEEDQDAELWGSVACIDIAMTLLQQTGSVTSTIPGIRNNTWRYYLGLQRPPARAHQSLPLAVLEPEQKQIPPLRRRLRELLAAATSKRAMHLGMPPLAILLVSTQRNIGKATVASDACQDIGLHAFVLDAYDIVNDAGSGGSDVKTEGFLKSRAERAMSCGPESCALLIRHIEALTADRMVSSIREVLADARVLIATTTEVDKVPDGVRGLFTHEMEMTAPDEGEREVILKNVVDTRGLRLDPGVALSSVALKTAALVAGDLVDVVDRAVVAQRCRLEKLTHQSSAASAERTAHVTIRDVQVAGGPAARGLTPADFELAVEAARKNFADAIGAPKIPNVTWDDVGGLDNVKDTVSETIQLPLERPELFAKGMKKRSGILFYGPPGTGKTLLAKAIATEYSLNFFSVKGPELLNMYIGESEANVRRVFQRARDARPCVVFFDELDSVAPKRGNQGDSGGVMDRIVSQLLAELDGMSSGEDSGGGVFVIGATNRPDLLDSALLRPGRFDKMLYLGVSDTHDKQLRILEALTRKFTLDPAASLRAVAEKLPFTYTGADFYALCSDAMLKAVTRQSAKVDAKIKRLNADAAATAATTTTTTAASQENSNESKHTYAPSKKPPTITTAYFFDHYATPEDIAVMVTEEDFMEAHRELIPSVSAGELQHYEHVRATFEGGRHAGSASGHGHGTGAGKGAAGAPASMSMSNTSSGGSAVKPSIKGKGKPVMGKGKGKAVATGNSDYEEVDPAEEDDGEEEEGNSGYNGYRFHEGNDGSGNGVKRDKGKGKAVAGAGGAEFRESTASDDEGLYD